MIGVTYVSPVRGILSGVISPVLISAMSVQVPKNHPESTLTALAVPYLILLSEPSTCYLTTLSLLYSPKQLSNWLFVSWLQLPRRAPLSSFGGTRRKSGGGHKAEEPRASGLQVLLAPAALLAWGGNELQEISVATATTPSPSTKFLRFWKIDKSPLKCRSFLSTFRLRPPAEEEG